MAPSGQRRYGPDRASCHVFVYRAGLLRRFGHDLRLTVERFEVTVGAEPASVFGRFDATSFKVAAALSDDGEAEMAADDREAIEENTRREVLEADEFPDISFVSETVSETDYGLAIGGRLTLHGETRPLALRATRDGDEWLARATIATPEFGIPPYRAFLGALKVKPEVEVEVRVPR